MKTRTAIALILALAPALAAAAPTLSTEYRYAAQISEYFVRGDAAVSESTVLKRGLRLAAWDAEDEQEASRVAVASAVYFFQVPLAARAVAIEVAYRPDEAARDKKVAGFLFVRNKAIEDQFAEQNKDHARPVEEPGFFGNTYFLPAAEPRAAITVPAENHVIDGVLEVHLTAGAGQVFDAQYVQVTALGAEVAPRIEEVAAQNYVPDPYAYTYFYYYTGPSYYPYATYYDCFYITSFDPIFWHQWCLRRAHYLLHHPWCYRPRHYHHHPLIVLGRPFYVVRPLAVRYRDDWYRRAFRVDPDRWGRDDLQHLVRRPTLRLNPDETRQRDAFAHQLVSSGRDAETQLRRTLGDRFHEHFRDPRRVHPQALHTLQTLRDREDIQRTRDAWDSLHAARWNAGDRRPAPRQHLPTPPRIRVESDRPTIAPVPPQLTPTTRPSITEERPPRPTGRDGFPGPRPAPRTIPPTPTPAPRHEAPTPPPIVRERPTPPTPPPAPPTVPTPPPIVRERPTPPTPPPATHGPHTAAGRRLPHPP